MQANCGVSSERTHSPDYANRMQMRFLEQYENQSPEYNVTNSGYVP